MPVSRQIKEAAQNSSWIRRMFEEGIRMKKEFGADKVFDFSLGNPDLEPPKQFHDIFVRLAQEDAPGSHGYMPNAGFLNVRDSIAKKVSREQGVELSGANIVMSVGAAGGLNVVMKTILNPGDEVIVIRPYFVEYGSYVGNHGGVIKVVDSAEDFSPDINSIRSALNDKTAAIIINSPNNPTGRLYSDDQIKMIGNLLREHSEKSGRAVYLVADEPYREIVYGGKIVPPVMSAYSHSIVITSYSKSLSLPGERIGYIAVNPKCDDFESLMGGLIMCTRTLGFVNAPALMQRMVAELTDVSVDVSRYEKRRDLFSKGLRDAGYQFADPEGAFYIFCKAPGGDDIKFVNHLKDHKILAVPGTGFGGPGYFRLCYCVPEEVISNSMTSFKKAMVEY